MDDATAQTDAAAEATASRDAVTVTPSESNRSHSGESAPGDVGECAAAAKADGSALEKDVKKRPASDIEDDVADEPVAKRAAGPKVGAARGRAKDEEKGETAGTAGGEDEEPVRARPRPRPPARAARSHAPALLCTTAARATLDRTDQTSLMPARPRSGSPDR